MDLVLSVQHQSGTHLGDFFLALGVWTSGVQGMAALSPIQRCSVGSTTSGRPC